MRAVLHLIFLLVLGLACATVGSADSPYADWVSLMRDEPRGPFSRIRWFCNDGEVLPPRAYACREHGGGHQHGEWSERTLALRDNGYLVANFLAGLDPSAVPAGQAYEDQYAQLLIEKFLIAIDEGWILRKALFYRGAIQEEDERAGGRVLLRELAGRQQWIGPRFVALRTGVRLLPHGEDSASIGRVRQWSAALSEEDPGFMPLRVKIHGSPDAGDAERVRAYLARSERGDLHRRMEQLALEIDGIYRAQPLAELLQSWAGSGRLPGELTGRFRAVADAWAAQPGPQQRFMLTADLLVASREALPDIRTGSERLALLDLGLRLEAENFRAASQLREQMSTLPRRQFVALLRSSAGAAYGAGVLNARLYRELLSELESLDREIVPLGDYRTGLNYLGRAPGWGVQAMRRYFYPSMLKLGEIEPQAMLFIQDQLRGSPLLFFSQLLDVLMADAGSLAGIHHRMFGEDIGVGLNALNPGLARGVLHTRVKLDDMDSFQTNGIYLLPETVADLPPVAGILTAGEGNPLSHVQLLARNLGIPNVSVEPGLARRLSRYEGRQVVMAVSSGGLVEISEDGSQWDSVFGEAEGNGGVEIRPDLHKLDLDSTRMPSLEQLSVRDSGRSVGPKAAKLGELRRHYPEAVARGLALPFGLFKQVALDQPHRSGTSLLQWMRGQYRFLATLDPGGDEHRVHTEQFRAELYQAILEVDLPDGFRSQLAKRMKEVFGSPAPGVFVRSDTNVEDLPGFTGAGLNLTLPNVVGFDELLQAIRRVWASPFTARAYAWRQSHMSQPEHVYTSVLLLESVGSDKSGVLVTADIESGARDTLSVAVNEGLGGAVDGQAAESLRIPLDGGPVRVLATATAPWRRLNNPAGGIDRRPASGMDEVLRASEIAALADFARGLPSRYPAIVDGRGEQTPADVEFGFLDGSLRLFQLRPFLDSRLAISSAYLQRMDAGARVDDNLPVAMEEGPLP